MAASADFSGVAPDTKILTKFGYRRISDLEGRTIQFWDGDCFTTAEVQRSEREHPVITVFTDGGQKIVCTPNYKFISCFSSNILTGGDIVDTHPRIEAIDLYPHMGLLRCRFPETDGDDERLPNPYLRGVTSVFGRQYGDEAVLESVSKERVSLNADLPFRYRGNIFDVPDDNSYQDRLAWIGGFFDACLNPGVMGSKDQSFPAGIARHSNRDFLLRVQLMLQTLGTRSSVVTIDDESGNYALMIQVHYIVELFNKGMRCYFIKKPTTTFPGEHPIREPTMYVKCVVNKFDISPVYRLVGSFSRTAVFNGIVTHCE